MREADFITVIDYLNEAVFLHDLKELANHHRGNVWAEESEPQGSDFIVELNRGDEQGENGIFEWPWAIAE